VPFAYSNLVLHAGCYVLGMALTPSTMVSLGTVAPSFSLPDTDGQLVSLPPPGQAAAVLVVFMCNHCPYVIHVAKQLAVLGRELPGRGVAMFGINSNDADAYPDDNPAAMRREVASRGYTFPYLFDEDQSVARAYRAACTPDFFLFAAGPVEREASPHAGRTPSTGGFHGHENGDLRLVYRGELDDSRPGNGKPVTGAALRAAIDAVLDGRAPSGQQIPSMGCNIKWKR
jgi:peroxiredoxin